MGSALLIDLNTPAKQPQEQHSLSNNFTPGIARAITERYCKNRRQSHLPKNNQDLSAIEESPMDNNNNSTVTFDTPLPSNLPPTAAYSCTPGVYDKENKFTTSKTMEASPKAGMKRSAGPTTPLLQHTFKRRALNDKSSVKNSSAPYTTSRLAIDHPEDVQHSPVKTPATILKMRRGVQPVEKPSCENNRGCCLDMEYGKWLAESQVKDLQQLVEFMELEREYL